MSYLDEAGLARYDGLLKGLALRDGAGPSLLNWQKTSAAGAVSFLPVPEMSLDPVVNFLFTETGPASGTKSPDNPSTIAGATQAKVTRCGKNLIRYPYYYETRTINDVTFTVSSDGSITASGTASARCVFWVNNTPSIPLAAGEEYVVSGCPSGGGWNSYSVQVEIRKDGSYVGSAQHFGTSESRNLIAASTDNRTGHVFIEIASGVTVSNLVFYPQLELGSVITSFEKYDGTDYLLPLGGTYYGGSVDLSVGTMTVTWGGETISRVNAYDAVYENTIRFATNTTASHKSAAYTDTSLACNKFAVANNQNDEEHCRLAGNADGSQIYFFIAKSRLDVSGAVDPSSPTTAEWIAAANAWLADNPVFVAFELATPYTIQLTPTQIYSLFQPDPYAPRINTVYSDQTSVQVGYPKSPQATQNELTNAIVSLGGNV